MITNFVLDKFQQMTGSSAFLRGRRRLEMLNKLCQDSVVLLEVLDVDFSDDQPADTKLANLPKQLRAPVLTTDCALNRIAQLQNVVVLNINELTSSLKSVVHPVEEITITVTQKVREPDQSVGLLDDGTRVMVKTGHQSPNTDFDVVVKRPLQNSPGNIIPYPTRI